MQHPLAQRAFGGALYAIPMLAAVWFGDPWYTLLIAALLALGAHELLRMLRAAGYLALPVTLVAMMLAAGFGMRLAPAALIPALTLILMASLAWQLRQSTQPLSGWAVTAAAGLYLGLTGGHLAALRQLPDGYAWALLCILATWATDSGAYAAGRLFGKHLLAPRVSPKKTWEGYIGGLLAGAATGALLGALLPTLGLWPAALAGALIGALSVLGDLIESMIKRQAGMKDSGALIPGHGGVLDRMDSLLWSGVIVYSIAALTAR